MKKVTTLTTILVFLFSLLMQAQDVRTIKVPPNKDTVVVKITTTLVPATSSTIVATSTIPTIPPTTNTAPIARAGSDITITLPVKTATLDGRASTDAENNIKGYGWRRISGPSTPTITDSNKSVCTIDNLIKGQYVYELRVLDNLNLFSVDFITIIVNDAVVPPVNAPPVANAGNNVTITLPVNSTPLTGSGTDPDGNIASYQWQQLSGPSNSTLSSTSQASITVSNLQEGTYVYRLTVRDNNNATAIDDVSVIVNPKQTGGTTQPITFSIIPFSDPDLVRPQGGAEQWHDRTDVNIPVEGTKTTPKDVYYRFVATRIATATRGQYNWSYFDGLINAAISKGQKFSFGIMTSYPEGTTNEGLINIGGGTASYPAWLQSAMSGEWIINGSWVPNYNDPTYLAWVLELNQAIYSHLQSTTFNGVRYKDVINSIDIRSYGSWGEWHSANLADNFKVSQYPAGTFPTAASLKKIVDAYTQGFPDIQLSAMIAGFDAQWLDNTWNPAEIAYYLLTQRNQKGMIGWRRDQWGALDEYLKSYLENNTRSYNGLVFKDSIMVRYKTAPITGEPPAWNPNEYSDLERQVRLYHAASFGNGNYGGGVAPSQLTTRNRIRAASKAAGHRLQINDGSITTSGNVISLTLNWQNVGLAPTYDNWDVLIELADASGQVKFTYVSQFKPRLFLPASTSKAVTDNFTANVPSGTYKVNVKVVDPTGYRIPLTLFMSGRNTDGSYTAKTINL